MSQNVLTDAVNGRKLVTFNYDDKPRLVEPHALGISTNGELVLRAFQVDGDSATSPRSWKLLIVDKMSDIELTDQRFDQPRHGYRQGDKAMTSIIAELPEETINAG